MKKREQNDGRAEKSNWPVIFYIFHRVSGRECVIMVII